MTGNRRDQRSEAAAEYRKLYKTKAWRDIRTAQLAGEPLCRFCTARGKVTPANVCDHVVPHKGDPEKFWVGPFQSLCKACHDGRKQSIEVVGYSTEVGRDGFPMDSLHPCNRVR